MDADDQERTMKIAFIGQKGIPATYGGIEHHVDRLSRGLAASGHDVSVYVRNWYTNKKLDNYQGVRLVHIPTIKSKHLDASIHSLLCSVHALFQNYDIIHYHGIGPAFFSLIPKLFGKNIVVTVHRLDWDIEKWGTIAKSLLKLGEYISIQIPQRTVVVSDHLKQYFQSKYAKDTIYIHHGTEFPGLKTPRLILEKYDLKEKDYVLFMGRLTSEKRVDWLIRAFQDLIKNPAAPKHLKLVIAGGSSATHEYVKKLQNMSKNDNRIIFTGYVTGREKEELLSNAIVFSLPSRLEGYPIVILEAKSYGLCCLASDIPPHREAIEHGIDGFLFKHEDLSDLTSKLIHLINNSELTEKMGKAAREKSKMTPLWSVTVEESLRLYKSLLQ